MTTKYVNGEALYDIAVLCGWKESEVARIRTLDGQLIHGVPEEEVGLSDIRVRDLGRSRKASDEAKKMHKSVSNAISRTIAVIGKSLPELNRHLEGPVTLGKFLSRRGFEWNGLLENPRLILAKESR